MERIKNFFYLLLLILGILIFFSLQQSSAVPDRSQRMRGEITYEQMFREIAREHDLDWQMLARHAYRESAMDPMALGEDNDMGLMQIIPSTWNEFAPQVGVTDPFDPYSNVLVGATYLVYLREHFGELGYTDPHWMLVAYNWGPYNLHTLLANGGGWEEIPALPRQYALDILQLSPNTSVNWEVVERELMTRTSIRR